MTTTQPNFPRSTARGITKIVTHPVCQPYLTGLKFGEQTGTSVPFSARRSPFHCNWTDFHVPALWIGVTGIKQSSDFNLPRLFSSFVFCPFQQFMKQWRALHQKMEERPRTRALSNLKDYSPWFFHFQSSNHTHALEIAGKITLYEFIYFVVSWTEFRTS